MRTLTVAYILIALALLLYGIYALFTDAVTPGLVALVIGLILVILAFINVIRLGRRAV